MQLEEERRLLYVAMTRARDDLALVQPRRFYVHRQPRRGDRHVVAPRTRFLPDSVLACFERSAHGGVTDDREVARPEPRPRVDVAARMRAMWTGLALQLAM